MPTLNEFGPIFHRLAESYPSYRPDDPKSAVRAYHRVVRRFTGSIVEEAVDELIRTVALYMPPAGALGKTCEYVEKRHRREPVGKLSICCHEHHPEPLGFVERSSLQCDPGLYEMLCGCITCRPDLWCSVCLKPLLPPNGQGERRCAYCAREIVPEPMEAT